MKNLFPNLEHIEILSEYSDKSNYELYKGIVLDKEDNKFKVVSGLFRDKKQFYEDLTEKGYVVRKVFEKKVFDWIEDNAKSTLDAYLMLSTAFSKWKNNNMLSDYYKKLLVDLPQLNRERIKGNPNTRGDFKQESVLKEYYVSPPVEEYGTTPSKIRIFFLDENGKKLLKEPFNKYSEGLLLGKFNLYNTLNNKPSKRFDDPNFYRHMWKLIKIDELDSSKYGVMVNENPKDYSILDKVFILTSYNKKNLNPDYKWGPKKGIIGNYDTQINQLKKRVNAIEQDPSFMFDADPVLKNEYNTLINKINDLTDVKKNIQRDSTLLLTPEEALHKKELAREIYKYSAMSNADLEKNNLSRADANRIAKELNTEYNNFIKGLIDKQAKSVYGQKLQLKTKIRELEQSLEDLNTKGSIANVDAALDKKNNIEKALKQAKYLLKKLNDNNKVNLIKNKDSEDSINTANEVLSKKSSSGKGYKAKFINKESVIPIVPEPSSIQYVNDGASSEYISYPVDGVITSPGAIGLNGTFITEMYTHSQLNTKLFDDKEKLYPKVREALLQIANKFKETLDLRIDPIDIYFTGSGASYNYNDSSDLDIHLVYDFENIGLNAELLKNYFIAKKQLFNNNYSITVKKMPVEVGVENINTPLVANSVYSLIKNDWVKKPIDLKNKELPDPDNDLFEELKQKVEMAIETKDSKVISMIWNRIYDIRRESLSKEGEYGKGNALFKKLRSLGYLERLKDAYYKAISDELSIESKNK